ncbi:MAG: hypothetical protein ABWY16_13360 [Pedobacter sp.]|uniref:hypothetical protein n=1 Tax=Pedobacter sp. TaxID=1411316 RepID=UPI0033984BA4
MLIRFISGFLILFSAFMGAKHGWGGLNVKPGDTGPVADLLDTLNLSQTTLKIFSILTIAGGFLLLPPQTFLAGNLLNICLFLFLIVRFLIVGDIRHAIAEIPFLLIPIVLIFLKHPLAAK